MINTTLRPIHVFNRSDLIEFHTFNGGSQSNLSTIPDNASQSYILEYNENISYALSFQKLDVQEVAAIDVDVSPERDNLIEINALGETLIMPADMSEDMSEEPR